MTDFLYAVVAFGIVLIPAIIIHELGHLLAAKAVGINVLEFGIGFPPKVARLFRWGETDFTLNLLPIGGFVRPLGEDFVGPVDDTEDEDFPDKPKKGVEVMRDDREELILRGISPDKLKSVNQASPLQRIFFMSAGAGANFVSALFFFVLIALIGLPEQAGARVQITSVYDNTVFAGKGVAVGDAIEKVDGVFFQSTDEFLDQWIARNGTPTTLTMRRLETQTLYDVTVVPTATTKSAQIIVLGIEVDSPGFRANLAPGDVIVSINGALIPNEGNPIEFLHQQTTDKAGQEVTLGILRSGVSMQMTLTPRVAPPPGQGRIGLSVAPQFATNDGLTITSANPQTRLAPQSLPKAVEYSVSQTAFILNSIVSLPGQLIAGKIDPELARPVSIVGISRIGGKFLEQSIQDQNPTIILNFLALISIFLGFTNLLPLPPLDGGRIVFVLIEMVRGKPVSPSAELMITQVGIVLLLTLGAVVILMDIIQPIKLP